MRINRAAYSYLLKTYGRQPKYWMGIAALIIQTILMRVVTVIIVARLAIHVTAGDIGAAKIDILIYLAVILVALIMRLLKELLSVQAENREYSKLIVHYYQKLIDKDMSFYRNNQAGYLASTFRQHGDSVMDLARLVRGELIQTPITLSMPVIVLLFASWKVGLTVLAVLLIQVAYIFWSSSITNKHRVKAHAIYRKTTGAVSDDITNIVALKTSGLGEAALHRLKRLIKDEAQLFWQQRKMIALLNAPREVMTSVGTAAAFWVIVVSTHGASESIGLVLLTITYMMQIYSTIIGLPDLIARHDDIITKLYPTLEYITDSYQVIKDPSQPHAFDAAKGEISVRDVTFAYRDQHGHATPIFKGLNLHISGGEQVGIVGLSGAGKSTLASLLLRFDEIDSGSITIDGIDIRNVRQQELRKKIAYVPQEPLLFHRTIKENLLYIDQQTDDTKMVQATKAAHAHEFISKLPQQYDTVVGERGVKLSGGQKQRIVIARAILKDAPIMLFDEATSALDSESERIIQHALPKIIGKRTALVIAHRLSTVANLDRIIVMHHGKVIEQGTHEELLHRRGRYYTLWQKQTVLEDA